MSERPESPAIVQETGLWIYLGSQSGIDTVLDLLEGNRVGHVVRVREICYHLLT